jgi:radical SAM protein with 4Fe4S-binding SPASM domain
MTDNTNLAQAKTSKTFCIMPWIHQYIGPPGDVKPCCMYHYTAELGSLKKESLVDIWNNDVTKQLRVDMLNGVVRQECSACNIRDEVGVSSKQTINAEYFNKHAANQTIVANTLPDGTVKEHKLAIMDVRFNNLCNFRCRTCSPHFSSSLILDHRALYNKPVDEKVDNSFQYPGQTANQAYEEMLLHIPHLDEVYFAGGEPMMQQEHFQTLEKLIESGNTDLKVRYNTNFSNLTFKQWDVIELWKKFTRVELNASLDASYSRAEYWRKGTDWAQIVDNRKRVLDECSHVRFKIGATVSWPNAMHVCDFHKEWVDSGLINIDGININLLDGPSYYSLKNIPVWKKLQIEEKVNAHLTWIKSRNGNKYTVQVFESIIKFMNSTTNQEEMFPAEKFHWIVSRLDHMYKKDYFFDVFPEHADMRDWLTELGYTFGPGINPVHSINFS